MFPALVFQTRKENPDNIQPIICAECCKQIPFGCTYIGLGPAPEKPETKFPDLNLHYKCVDLVIRRLQEIVNSQRIYE